MDKVIEIVFLGLIAIALEGEPRTGPTPSPRAEKTQPIDAYLLTDSEHISELLVHGDYVVTSDPASDGRGSCEPSDGHIQPCVAIGTEYDYGACDNDHPYVVWCLRESRVVFDQPTRASASYETGHRRFPGRGRHFDKTYPGPDPASGPNPRRDISWIPELKRAVREGKIKKQLDATIITGRIEGLRGDLTALDYETPKKTKLLDGPVWKWCALNEDATSCGLPYNLRNYDQVFDGGAKLRLPVASRTVWLLPWGGSAVPVRRIELNASPVSRVLVVNRPRGKMVTSELGKKCVATHFEKYSKILEGSPPRRYVPYYDEIAGKCDQVFVVTSDNPNCGPDDLAESDDCDLVETMSVLDSFCPPTIVQRNRD